MENAHAQRGETIIEGTVKSLIFHSEESGYTVLRLTTEAGEEITAVGTLGFVAPGEELSASGHFTTHPSYGEQFQISVFERRLPATSAGILDYLSTGAVRGIGPKSARKIVEKFGEETFDVLASAPERLTEIRGITIGRAREIQERFLRQTAMRTLMEFLIRYNLPAGIAVGLYKNLGEFAIEALKQNPYLVCSEYYGVDFTVADAMALSIGLAADCDVRVDAGVLFELSYNMHNGHAFIPRDKLIAITADMLEVSKDLCDIAIDRLLEWGELFEEEICGLPAIYLSTVYVAESRVAARLLELGARTEAPPPGIEETISASEADGAIQYAASQREAIRRAAASGMFVLTGGPGTGKTTTVRGMLDVFQAAGRRVLLAAPTGRAAKRLSELTGEHEAKTIHRLLEAAFNIEAGMIQFGRNKNNRLSCDVIIVDEISMVDIVLMEALLDALPDSAQLILVGDADQLPSVGPGNLLRDLMASGAVPSVALTEIFRQAQESLIVLNAHRINRGEMPDLAANGPDFYFIQRQSPAAAADAIIEMVKERIPARFGIESGQIQVLCPSRRGVTGTVTLNRLLQDALNPADGVKQERRFGEYIFREGDKIMQIKNNYDIQWTRPATGEMGEGIFNGDIGVIEELDNTYQYLRLRFDERVVNYPFDMLNELEPAYAMTVHKAQGSEFDAVVLAVHGAAPQLLSRSVLYTAVTRAKSLLVMIGLRQTVEKMVANNKVNRRYTALRARLTQGKENNA